MTIRGTTRPSGPALFFAASVFAASILAASVGEAQSPPQVRVRGTIDSVSGQTLTMKARDGAAVTIKLADSTPVRAVVKASLADVKQGSFVGATGMPQPDGTQKAIEIHIFPEALRGTGEGSRPWDSTPNSSMTNGAVDSQVAVSDGNKIVLKYKDGEKTLVVTPDTAIVAYAPATMADVKPGAKAFVTAAKQPDGTLTASNIAVGRDGVTPPM
jgi:Domain of unknown function (DUF5666)